MASYHETTIVGHCGRDPEMRTTQSGTPVCSVSVAVTDGWTDASGERRESTTWYSVSAWKEKADILSKYVRKGDPLMVVGTVKARGYAANDGTVQASLELNAQRIVLLKSRANGGNADDDYDGFTPPPRSMDDIPF